MDAFTHVHQLKRKRRVLNFILKQKLYAKS